MNKFLKEGVGWGVGLWLIGYLLGMVLFPLVATDMIGWIITPVGAAITLWVLFKKINGDSLKYYLSVAAVWTVIAVVFDYLFLVKMLQPVNYYKFDIYLYYALTLFLPLLVGWIKLRKIHQN